MTAELKPYPAMRDSGVPWLGEIPKHWEVRRLKYILRERDTRSAEGAEQLLRVSQYTGVTQRRRADGGDEPDTRAESLVGYKRVEPKELVVNIMLAWNGSMGVSSFSGIASPAYCVYRFGPCVQPWYFHHLLRSPAYKARIKAVSTGVVESRLRLYTDDLYRLEALVPPLPEQAAIVRFLDHADRRIRRYIRAKQKLIKLLEEQKQAIIHRAVTRGLDPKVRLKPSGVEWLGEVPEHWEISQLRRLVRRGRRITYGIVQPGEPDASGRFMVRGQDYSFGWARPETIFRVSDAIELPYKRARLSTGDLVLTIVGGVGNVAIVPAWLDGANITQTTARVSVDPTKADAAFIAAVLQGPLGRRSVELYVKGAAQPGLNLEHVRLFLVPVPPVDEQRRIVAAVGRETGPLQTASDRAQREISLLREYRTRLIADVVTGKVDVREAASRRPDEAEEPELLDEADAPTDAEEDAADELDAVPEEAEA
jgi:type I restriction enzyme, S subunit